MQRYCMSAVFQFQRRFLTCSGVCRFSCAAGCGRTCEDGADRRLPVVISAWSAMLADHGLGDPRQLEDEVLRPPRDALESLRP